MPSDRKPLPPSRMLRCTATAEDSSEIRWPEPVERIQRISMLPAVKALEAEGVPFAWLIGRLRQAAVEMMSGGEVDAARGLPRSELANLLHSLDRERDAIHTLLTRKRTLGDGQEGLLGGLSLQAWDVWAEKAIYSMLDQVGRPRHRPSFAPIWAALVEIVDQVKERTPGRRLRVWGPLSELFRAAFPYMKADPRHLQDGYCRAKRPSRPRQNRH
jgi:hypothetical protein